MKKITRITISKHVSLNCPDIGTLNVLSHWPIARFTKLRSAKVRNMISRSSKIFASRTLNSKSATRPFSSLPSQLYSTVWRKSNVLYVTYVIVGCIILEGVYGSATNMLWETANRGVSRAALEPQRIRPWIFFIQQYTNVKY